MKKLLECVPNISEGKNPIIIQKIAQTVQAINGVKLLHIDSGKSANRTVFTFAGEPIAVVEAAFQLIKKTSELIDMSQQKGEHPRSGATDVCPLVPISGITIQEVILLSEQLAKRVAEELQIPVYLYEESAKKPERRSLANCRAGGYEGLQKKLKDNTWKPDYGSSEYTYQVKRSGITTIGARKLMIAYNINLNTKSAEKANLIAKLIRETGYLNKEKIRVLGALKGVKALGWYIEEFGKAQLSMNLMDIEASPLHIVFEKAQELAKAEDVVITGSELIGLIPLQSLLDAADYFSMRERNEIYSSDQKKLDFIIPYLGLAELAPFDPQKKIIEYCLAT